MCLFSGDIFGIVPCDTELKIYLPTQPPFTVYSVSLGPKSKECKSSSNPDLASPDASDIAKHLSRIINMLRNNNRRIILVANVGLWYNVRSEFEEVVPPLLKYLNSVAGENSNVVAWHETMTQHWISKYGTYTHIQHWVLYHTMNPYTQIGCMALSTCHIVFIR